jgi:hypothetical protein
MHRTHGESGFSIFDYGFATATCAPRRTTGQYHSAGAFQLLKMFAHLITCGQVPLATLLNKFNGESEKAYNTYNENFIKRFTLIDLPPYLIVYYKRFLENRYFIEKNPTIVNFPIK